MCGDSGIDSILIDNTARLERQKKRIEQDSDQINTEVMLTRALLYILCIGILGSAIALGTFIAKGNAIPTYKGPSYANSGK